MQSISFSETVIARVLFIGFFTLMGGAIVVALLIKVGDNPLWLIPAILAALVVLLLGYVIWASYNSRQHITITPQSISASSSKRGETKIRWLEIEKVYEVQNKTDEIREAYPGLELLLTYYIMLPNTTSGERRGLLIIKAKDGRKIALRQHMIYDYRMDQLLEAIDTYAPSSDPTTEVLRSNMQN